MMLTGGGRSSRELGKYFQLHTTYHLSLDSHGFSDRSESYTHRLAPRTAPKKRPRCALVCGCMWVSVEEEENLVLSMRFKPSGDVFLGEELVLN